MGPQSFDCGNADRRQGGDASGLRLQWGRSRLTAEILFAGGWQQRLTMLQWGRSRLTAEMPLAAVADTRPAPCFNGAAVV